LYSSSLKIEFHQVMFENAVWNSPMMPFDSSDTYCGWLTSVSSTAPGFSAWRNSLQAPIAAELSASAPSVASLSRRPRRTVCSMRMEVAVVRR
jgi:hypothetical protein